MPVSGKLSITVGEADFAGDDEVIYIPPHCSHSFSAYAPNQFFVFDVPVKFFPLNEYGYKSNYRFDKKWEAIRTLVFSEVENSGREDPQRINDLTRYIIGMLEKRKVFASLEFIHRNYHNKINLRELADIEHYSESYYCEWFQQHTGATPLEYIRRLRFDKARHLLAESRLSLLQVAQEIGYENQSTLTQLFYRYAGISPFSFRKKYPKNG